MLLYRGKRLGMMLFALLSVFLYYAFYHPLKDKFDSRESMKQVHTVKRHFSAMNSSGMSRTILFWNRPYRDDPGMVAEYLFSIPLPRGAGDFVLNSYQCGKCLLTYNRSKIDESSAVVFFNHDKLMPRKRTEILQRFVWWWQEGGAYKRFLSKNEDRRFDWSMTPSIFSEIYSPYASFSWILRIFKFKDTDEDIMKRIRSLRKISDNVPFVINITLLQSPSTAKYEVNKITDIIDPSIEQLLKGKHRLALWFESDCVLARQFIVYGMEAEGFPVEKFGNCYQKTRIGLSHWNSEFYQLISKYKFYLSFENNIHCRGYITEKTWYNALYSGTVPIIWGPHRKDVRKVLPPKTYIHVEDFSSVKELVKYLQYLNHNDTAYGEYLLWRTWVKYLDKDGVYHPENLVHLPENEKPNREVKSLLEKYAVSKPIGFCKLCQKIHSINDSISGAIAGDLKYPGERKECSDQKAAMRLAASFLH